MPASPPSPQDVAGAVLQAARLAFSARGYTGTTLKSVAVAAGVAPDVVRSLYRNKEQLFAAALTLPFDPAQGVPRLIAPGLDGLGERLVRLSLTWLDDEQVRADLARVVTAGPATVAATGVATGVAAAAPLAELRALTEYLAKVVVDPVVSALGVPDARLRATLITSHLVGMATTRYVLRLEPLASASEDDIVRLLGPAIQDLLDPTRAPLGRSTGTGP